MNIAIFLTTRYGSTRLHEKALMKIGGETVTDILIERIKEAGVPIIMTVPMTVEDNLHMSPIAKRHGIGYYAGEIYNIITRHLDCAMVNNVDWVINVDGDDILTCPDLIDVMNKTIICKASDLNQQPDCIQLCNYPLGLNLIAYTPSRLVRTCYERDTNWGGKILRVGDVIKLAKKEIFNDCRLTLDYMPDFIVLKHIIETLGKHVDSEEICKFMQIHPEICNINNYLNTEYYARLENLSKQEEVLDSCELE